MLEENRRMMERLQEGVFKLLGKKIDIDDEEVQVSYIGFYNDELKVKCVPEDVINILAEPIMSNSFGYKAGNGDFYEVCHLYYNGPNPYEIWFKNGDIVENPLGQPTYF